MSAPKPAPINIVKEKDLSEEVHPDILSSKLTVIADTRLSKDIEEEKQRKSLRQENLIATLQTSSSQYSALMTRFGSDRLDRIIKSLNAYKYGYNASAPLLCLGPEKCPFFHACPLGDGVIATDKKLVPQYDSIEDFPIGDQCILEKVFIEQKLIDYIKEFDIDPNMSSELGLINDLALVDLHKNRCLLFLAAGDRQGEGTDFMKLDSSFDPTSGSESKQYREHPVIEIIDRLERRRFKILEELIGTRKGKATMAAKFSSGLQEGALLQEIEKVRKAIEITKASGGDTGDMLELP